MSLKTVIQSISRVDGLGDLTTLRYDGRTSARGLSTDIIEAAPPAINVLNKLTEYHKAKEAKA